MTHRTLLVAALLLLFASCGSKTVFDDSRTFAGDTWKRFEPEQFEADIANADDCYDIYVTVTIDTARFRESALPLTVKLSNENRETRTLFGTVVLRNREGTWMGQFDSQGLLTCRHKLRDYFFFNSAGLQEIQIGQRTSKYEISGIRQLGLTIVKAELELPDD